MNWDLKPTVILGCLALLLGYVWAVRGRIRLRAAAFFAGVLLIFLALCSPLDMLADQYLFSVHMAKHILFVLVVPALLLIAMPAEPFDRLLSWSPARAAERFLRTPAVAWIAGIGVMAIWHIPALFNAALAHEPLHVVEHLSLLVAGTIYWWPVLSPLERSRMRPVPQAAAYLFSSCLACTTIGIAITFAPAPLYAPYAQPPDASGILRLIRDQWGISAETDQQIGGLLMWVPCCLVYLTATLAMFARWYGDEERATQEV